MSATMSEGTVRAGRDVFVLGGSLGSGAPMRHVLEALPADLPAALFVVQHRLHGPWNAAAPFARRSRLPVVVPEDRAALGRGTVYVAPSDRHLLLEGDVIRVMRGPRENLVRPSIDVLFRSAAVELGTRVVGAVFSGSQFDGEAGLLAIRRCGGVTVVQDPNEATSEELPRRALRTEPDYCLPASDMADLFVRLTRTPRPDARPPPADLALEARAAAMAMMRPEELARIGARVDVACPECGGTLFHTSGGAADHFRCYVGHSYDPTALLEGHELALERALWVAYRTLIERIRLIEQLADSAREKGQFTVGAGYEQRLTELHDHVRAVRRVLQAVGSAGPRLPNAERPNEEVGTGERFGDDGGSTDLSSETR